MFYYGLHVEQETVRVQGQTATSSVVQTWQFLWMYVQYSLFPAVNETDP